MATSMENNTLELQEILNIVNSLPEPVTYETWEGGSY